VRSARGRHLVAKASSSSQDEENSHTAPEIIVIGLGPGDPKQITLEAWELLTAPGAQVHCRTRQHPTLDHLGGRVNLTTFDHVYESTKLLEEVYPQIAAELFEKAIELAAAADAEDDDDDASAAAESRRQQRRRVVYAVPGDPCVAENSVAILRALAPARGVTLRIVPGLSFLEPTLAAVGADVMPRLCIVDAIDVARAGHAVGVTVDAPVLLCQLYSTAVASDVKLTLMVGVDQTSLQFLVLSQSTHQLIEASMGPVTNLTPPGVSNPRKTFGRRHRLLTAGMVHVTDPYGMQQYPEDWPVRLVHAAGTEAEIVETLVGCSMVHAQPNTPFSVYRFHPRSRRDGHHKKLSKKKNRVKKIEELHAAAPPTWYTDTQSNVPAGIVHKPSRSRSR
jgi:uncharacterized protein YabN with tetrapyrrole methylase and pyrophosphatase domain